ncbi:hypothetical protein F7725_023107 [Dissostichus mawsoni]|uniref:Uncharacterized protein n=1 Tax=Dissostichus mawsoni TaxID=36200 RepID=A0A7J5YZP5_DISMA|nr:hypothetical protein F7725_023107 [Dissostichus mawsoni]
MTGTGKAMVSTPAMAHNDPTNLPPMVEGHMSPYPTVVIVTTAHQNASGILAGVKRLAEDLETFGVPGKFKDPEDSDQTDDPEDGQRRCLLTAALMLRQVKAQGDKIWNYCHNIDYVHDVFKESCFTGTRQKPHGELKGEPHDAKCLHHEKRICERTGLKGDDTPIGMSFWHQWDLSKLGGSKKRIRLRGSPKSVLGKRERVFSCVSKRRPEMLMTTRSLHSVSAASKSAASCKKGVTTTVSSWFSWDTTVIFFTPPRVNPSLTSSGFSSVTPTELEINDMKQPDCSEAQGLVEPGALLDPVTRHSAARDETGYLRSGGQDSLEETVSSKIQAAGQLQGDQFTGETQLGN